MNFYSLIVIDLRLCKLKFLYFINPTPLQNLQPEQPVALKHAALVLVAILASYQECHHPSLRAHLSTGYGQSSLFHNHDYLDLPHL